MEREARFAVRIAEGSVAATDANGRRSNFRICLTTCNDSSNGLPSVSVLRAFVRRQERVCVLPRPCEFCGNLSGVKLHQPHSEQHLNLSAVLSPDLELLQTVTSPNKGSHACGHLHLH